MTLRTRLLVLFVLVLGCGQDRALAPGAPMMSGEAGGASEGAADPIPTAVPRKLIRIVHLDLVVADTEAAARQAEEMVAAVGGYVSAKQARRRSEQMHYRITLRLPGESLDTVVEQLKALALRLESERQETEDVTDRYVDLEARLKTLELTETELQGLLAEAREKGHKVEGIMAIYRELTEIRSKSETVKGRLNLLANQVALSTIHLTLGPDEATKPVVTEGWQPVVVARNSVRTLLGVLRGLADLAIFLLIVVLPVAAIVGGVGWLGLRVWRRVRRR